MRKHQVEVGKLYVVNLITTKRIHSSVIKLVDVGERVATWEHPGTGKRGYINYWAILIEFYGKKH